MKMKLFLIFTLFVSHLSWTQSWQTIPTSSYTNLNSFQWNHGQFAITLDRQHFKINPYDQSIWGFSNNIVYRVDNTTGDMTVWDENSAFFAVLGQKYNDICFTSVYTYIVTQYSGVFKYDGTNWTTVTNLTEGLHLSTNADTVWVARLNEPFLKITNTTVLQGNITSPSRIQSRDSLLFRCGSVYSGGLAVEYPSGYHIYDVTTDGFYLGYKNYDFKFTPQGDTLFTSGNRGFSVAVDGTFIDTLTQYNTVNMPNMSITEFEFDEDHNIWAVFSNFNSAPQPQKIGFLDRSTNTWTHLYDESNSPIQFSRLTIELDTNGNVWVANMWNLHVLNINNAPNWLSTKEIDVNQTDFEVYPNPIKNEFSLKSEKLIESVVLTDMQGREISQLHAPFHLKENLPTGNYFLQILDIYGNSNVKRIVKD